MRLDDLPESGNVEDRRSDGGFGGGGGGFGIPIGGGGLGIGTIVVLGLLGWALGIERIVEVLEVEGRGGSALEADAHLVVAGDAERRYGFSLAEQLRDRVPGLKLWIGGPAAGFKAQLRRADRSGARFALIVGESELAAGKVSVKPLREDKPQQLLSVDECAALLAERRSA